MSTTYDIVTVGRRRFRLVDIDTKSEPYLMASVEWLPEPSGQEELADLLAPRVLSVFCLALSRRSRHSNPTSRCSAALRT